MSTRTEGAGLRTVRVWTMDTIRANCDEVGQCLLWRGTVDSYGYPRTYIGGASQLLRPYVWRFIMGKQLRSRYRLVMSCDNRLCLSEQCITTRTYKAVAELHASKVKSNPMMVARFREGAKAAGHSRLTPEIVAEIRARAGTDLEISTAYGIDRSTAGKIRRGDIWAAPKVATSVFNFGATL